MLSKSVFFNPKEPLFWNVFARHANYVAKFNLWCVWQGRRRGVPVPPPHFGQKARFLEVEKSWYGYVGVQEQNCAQNRLETRFYTTFFFFLNFARLRREFAIYMSNFLKTADFGGCFAHFNNFFFLKTLFRPLKLRGI